MQPHRRAWTRHPPSRYRTCFDAPCSCCPPAIKLVAEIALMALLGQGLLAVLAGERRHDNFFYRMLQALTGPFTRVTRLITPRVVIDRHIPFATFALVLALWLFATLGRSRCAWRSPWPRRFAAEHLPARLPPMQLAERADYLLLKWRALAWLTLGRAQPARQALDAMLARWPQDAYALSSRAHLRAEQGDMAGAIDDARRLVQQHPARSAADWFNLAFMLEARGELQEAEAAFRRALELDPKLDRACTAWA
jgi:tetratricopeptide (TPR) repeat protein